REFRIGRQRGDYSPATMALVHTADARFGYASGYHQFLNSGCRANSITLGSAAVHLPAEFRFHISRNLVSARSLSSIVWDHRFVCYPRIVPGNGYASYFADLYLDRGSWLHDPKPDLLVPVAFLTIVFAIPKYLVHARIMRIPPQVASAYNIGLGLLIGVCVWFALTGGPNWARRRKFRWYEITSIAIFLSLSTALCLHLNKGNHAYRERNFYGAVAVHENWDRDMLHLAYELMHGRIIHGIQV